MRIRATALVAALVMAGAAAAQPVGYLLQADQSAVAFEVDFGGTRISGRMPVARADLALDMQRIANSRVSVVIDVAGATASFPFAAQALKGPSVLDARRYPEIAFASGTVRPAASGAEIDGILTMHGVSRPMTFQAQIFRQRDTEPGDLRLLSILLTGTVLRSEFGATGWADMVGDEVRLTILARIERAQ